MNKLLLMGIISMTSVFGASSALSDGKCVAGPNAPDYASYTCNQQTDRTKCEEVQIGCEWELSHFVCVPGPSLPDEASSVCAKLSFSVCSTGRFGCVLQEKFIDPERYTLTTRPNSMIEGMASIHLFCTANDSWNDTADITMRGDQVLITFADRVDPPTLATGYVGSDGNVNFVSGVGCGNASLNIDPGLLNGNISEGSAVLSDPGNYGCGGDTTIYQCRKR